MDQPSPPFDLRNVEFEEFVHLLCDHSLKEDDPETETPVTQWYHGVGFSVPYDPELLARHYTRLFSHPTFLNERFSDAQLEAGLGALIFRWGFEGNVSEVIWTKELGLDKREALVRSMYFLFADLFAVKPLWSACFMWWDTLADCFNPDLLHDDFYPDSAFIQEVMFSVLKDILHIPSNDCRQAALHGMNHLQHPGTEAYIEAFLNSRQDLSPKLMKYARRCMVFNVE